MADKENIINELINLPTIIYCGFYQLRITHDLRNKVIVLLKEQETEIRQLRLALDIAKGTCKGIKSDGGQFADMPTMQPAT